MPSVNRSSSMPLPRRIVIFGASTVYGTADSERGGFAARLRHWHEARGERNRVYALGVWGEETRGLVARISSEAAARRPHLIMLYPGFNDSRREGPDAPPVVGKAEFRELISEMIRKARAVAKTIVITGLPFDERRTTPLAGTRSFYFRKDAEEYTELLREAAREEGAELLDFFTALSARKMDELLAPDGLHGNSRCHEAMFELARDFLLQREGA